MGLYTFLYGNPLYRLYTIHIQPARLVPARLVACHAYSPQKAYSLYSHTRHTSYSAIQPPSEQGPAAGGPGPREGRESWFALSLGFQRCLDLRHLRGWSSSVGSLGPSRLSTHFCFKIGYHAFCFLPQGALGPQEAGSGHYTHVFLFFFVLGGRALMLIPLKASERGPTYQYINPGPPPAPRASRRVLAF